MEYICLAPRIENIVISLLSCLSKFCHQVYITSQVDFLETKETMTGRKQTRMKLQKMGPFEKKTVNFPSLHPREAQATKINFVYQKHG